MKEEDLIGQKVCYKKVEVYTIIGLNFETNRILFDNGKKEYDFRFVIKNKIIRFLDENIQKEVEDNIDKLVPLIPSQGDDPIIFDPPEPPEPQLVLILDEAIKLFKHEGIGKNISNIFSGDLSVLNEGKCYGKKAYDIYRECCRTLGFDWSKKHYFDLRQVLYSEDATPDGFAVWMLPNNSYTGKNSGNWANIFKDNGDTIYEVWKEDFIGDSSDRVTFAKQRDGQYVFMGIYTLENIRKVNYTKDGIRLYYIKRYRRISKSYSN